MPVDKIETDSLGSTLNAPTATALTTASGSAPSYSARAWVNFNGTGTVAIRASGNVSSITDNGVGDYTVNFTTAMPDANYNVTTSVDAFGSANASVIAMGVQESSTPATSNVRVSCHRSNGTNYDATFCNVSIFR